MENDIFLELAAKSLSGEITSEESEKLNTYLKEEKYSEQYKFLKTNWDKLELPDEYSQFDVQRGLKKLHNKINEYSVPSVQMYKRRTFGEVLRTSYLFKAAASFIFIALVSAIVLYFNGVFDEEETITSLMEKTTQLGQKSILTLLDGTTITLNADSKLKFPQEFTGNTREIYLDGEAYFEVAHDTSLPFIVHSGNFDVTVLGTVFDVKSFPKENSYSVSLIKGKVKVTKASNFKQKINSRVKSETKEVILQPDQQYSFNRLTGRETIDSFDNQQVTGWKDNNLKFNKTPLSEVFVQLERAYGIEFSVEGKSADNIKITTNFKNTSFWTIVKMIKSITNFDFKTVGNDKDKLKEIIFYKSEK